MSRHLVAFLIVFAACWLCVAVRYYLSTTRAERDEERRRAREDDDGSHVW